MTLRVHPDQIIAETKSPLLGVHETWERVRIRDICELQNGGAFRSALFNTSGCGMPLIRIRDVGRIESKTYFSGEYREDYLVLPGDLIVAMDGDFRVAVWKGQVALLNQRVCRLRVRNCEEYCQQFLGIVLQGYLDAVHAVTSAVTVKHLSSRTVQELPVPLPPVAEQERIVDCVKELFTRLNAVERTLDSLSNRLVLLRSAILADAFCADRDLPSRWTRTTVGEVAEVQLGRQRSPKHHTGKQMRPYLRAANVTWKGISFDDVKEMNFNDDELERYRLKPGDLLLNEASGTPSEVGKPVIWNDEIEDCCFQNTLLRLRTRDLDLGYLYWYCYFSALTGRFGDAGRGVNIRHLGKRGLSRFPIPVAPRSEQCRIADDISDKFDQIRSVRESVEDAQRRVAALRRSVLTEAFAGRLVPQDPSDEPASVLLERIAASRPAKPKRRSKART